MDDRDNLTDRQIADGYRAIWGDRSCGAPISDETIALFNYYYHLGQRHGPVRLSPLEAKLNAILEAVAELKPKTPEPWGGPTYRG